MNDMWNMLNSTYKTGDFNKIHIAVLQTFFFFEGGTHGSVENNEYMIGFLFVLHMTYEYI